MIRYFNEFFFPAKNGKSRRRLTKSYSGRAAFPASGLFLFISAFVCWGCEKSIQFDLKDADPKLVVEATIENGTPPVVVLTTSINYFSTINSAAFAGSFVHGATIYASDGIKTHRLKEYKTDSLKGYALYYYSIDSASLATAFLGQLNHSYSLKISVAGKDYEGLTTIPAISKRIDSIWWRRPLAPAADSTGVQVLVKATDPPGYGNYIRYFTKVNRGLFLPPLVSVFDDFFIDGTTYEVQLEPGVDRNKEGVADEHFFHRGDTVVFKVSSIDRTTYDFWHTLEYSYSSVGNPFSTPTKVLGNISNGALGVFGGYATQYRTLIIPH